MKKMEKAGKADEKYALGFSILESSDVGKKKKRSSSVDSDTGDESDGGCMSAAYRLENKIPVEQQSDRSSSSASATATVSKKRKASPPKQSRILSKQEVKSMYPNLSLKSDEEDEEEDVKLVQRKVSTVKAHSPILKI